VKLFEGGAGGDRTMLHMRRRDVNDNLLMIFDSMF